MSSVSAVSPKPISQDDYHDVKAALEKVEKKISKQPDDVHVTNDHGEGWDPKSAAGGLLDAATVAAKCSPFGLFTGGGGVGLKTDVGKTVAQKIGQSAFKALGLVGATAAAVWSANECFVAALKPGEAANAKEAQIEINERAQMTLARAFANRGLVSKGLPVHEQGLMKTGWGKTALKDTTLDDRAAAFEATAKKYGVLDPAIGELRAAQSTALQGGITSSAALDAKLKTDPQFKKRYDENLVFRVGVDSVVQAATSDPPFFAKLQEELALPPAPPAKM